MISPLALDIAHLFAGGLVLVSVMLLYQDRMTGLISTFALPFRVSAMKVRELLHLPPGRLRAGFVVTCAAVVLLFAFSAGGGPAR